MPKKLDKLVKVRYGLITFWFVPSHNSFRKGEAMPGMGMSLSPSMTHRLSMSHRMSFSLSQRHLISAQQTMLQIELTGVLRDERYTPRGECPSCRRDLKPNEILAGFLRDVTDFTTRCTGCGHRFEPKLICFGQGGNIELRFLCGVQAQEQLRTVSHLPPSEIAREYPSEYRSAVVHYGTLAAMFADMDVPYDQPELEGWQAKVEPFLGRMPDTVIAKCVGEPVSVIRRLRNAQGISRFTRQLALEEAEQEAEE